MLSSQRGTELRTADGTVTHKSEHLVTSVQLGEPLRSEFEIPSDYREMSPSAVQAEIYEGRTLKPVPDQIKESMKTSDARYYASQSDKP